MGELAKMKITAYSDSRYSSRVRDFEARINPNSVKYSYSIEYDNRQAPGTMAREMRFKQVNPTEISFDFVFDGTGIAYPAGAGVYDDVNAFVSVLWDFNGSSHRTHYLMLEWGNFKIYKGVLTKLDIEYKLFKPDATPLRAIAKATFKSAYADGERVGMEKKSSPDLTHVRTVKAGDKLVLMTNEIYGTPDLYLEIARINGLSNFRNLEPGTQLFFPPIDKNTA